MVRRRWLWLCVVILAAGQALAAGPGEAPTPAKSRQKPEAIKKVEKSDPAKQDDYELLRVFVDTLDQVQRNYVKEVDRRELVEAAIQGVLSKLDPYSSYVGPQEIDEFRANVDNEFGGIGIQLDADNDGQLRVLSPMIGTPAYRAGVLAGDRIVDISGESTEGMHYDDAVKRLKGEPGTKVTLTVEHAATEEQQKVTLTREMIHVETVLGDRRTADDKWDFMLDHEKRIGYIRLVAFSRETYRDLRKAMEELRRAKLKGLILDLRFNPGGLLNAAIEISGLFISKGRIVSTAGRNSPERKWDAQSGDAFEGFPMVVLMNRYSASASEIVAACLQDHKRAAIVGERSWGKGSVQNLIELDGGNSVLKLTTASYKRPSGKNIHKFPDAKDTDEWGVTPDAGYELKLSEREMYALLSERRQRDVLQPHARAARAVSTSTTPGVKPAEKKPEKAVEKATGKPAVAIPDTPAATPLAAKAGDAKPTDRQLQMALTYLSAELVRAGKP